MYYIDDVSCDELFVEIVGGCDFVVVLYMLCNNDILLIEGCYYMLVMFFEQIKFDFDQLYVEVGQWCRLMLISVYDWISGMLQMVCVWDDFLYYV